MKKEGIKYIIGLTIAAFFKEWGNEVESNNEVERRLICTLKYQKQRF